MKALQLNTPSTITVSAFLLSVTLSGCSFIEDRQGDIVPIVDAAPAQRVENNNSKNLVEKKTAATYTYTVRSGDTLGTISQEYLGSANRYTELLELNELRSNDAIYVGQRLKLPTKGLRVSTDSEKQVKPQQSTVEPLSVAQPGLEKLLKQEKFQEAIQWIVKQEDLGSNTNLQSILVDSVRKQVTLYRRQQNITDAESLLSNLISEAPVTDNNKSILKAELSKLRAEQDLMMAKRFADNAQYDQSYSILLNAWKTIGQPLEENILFTGVRNKVSEDYHQKALRLYRNQDLDDALNYWKKILAINPNDDLALVYQDRVKSLQNKLDNL